MSELDPLVYLNEIRLRVRRRAESGGYSDFLADLGEDLQFIHITFAERVDELATLKEENRVLREALEKICPDCGFGRPVRADGYHLQLHNEVEHGTSAPGVVGKCRLTPGLRDALTKRPSNEGEET